MKNKTLAFLKPLSSIGKRILPHSRLIAFVLAMLTLIYCVMTIQQVFDLPTDEAYRTDKLQNNIKTQFDKKTIDQVKQLRTTDDQSITLPAGHINPFVE